METATGVGSPLDLFDGFLVDQDGRQSMRTALHWLVGQ
jgi:hypothetical protein